MNRIKELPKSSSHLISSTQIITSVQNVVKELIENAIDSGGKNIEIKLEDYGIEKIEVKDNGAGIHKEDIHFVAKPHCTSKITSYLDLDTIQTYGFRGEALAAVSAVSDLVISTKKADDDFGFTYTFDHNGNLLSSKPCPCNPGTSVMVSNLFKNLPVRRQIYRSDKNKKEELKRVEDILISFGCILNGIRFVLYHNRSLIWQKSVVNNTIDGLTQTFGNSIADHLENCEYADDETQIKIEVFLPKQASALSCAQMSAHRSIIAVNKRPVRMKVFDKLLKEHYSKVLDCGKSRYPVCYISISVPSSEVDVNFEPNKTAVAMHKKDLIVDQLSKILSTFYCKDKNQEPDATSKNIPPVPETLHHDKLCDNMPTILENASKAMSPSNCPSLQLTSNLNSGLNRTISKHSITSSKLSRKNDFKTPSNKRTKTCFATPHKEIQNHINTIESFLSPPENKSEDEIPKSDFTASPAICAQREDLFHRQKDNLAASPTLNKVIVLDSLETPVRKRHISDPCTKITNFYNGTIQNVSVSKENTNLQTINIHGKDLNENSVKTVMRLNDQNIETLHGKENSELLSPVTSVNAWSRGINPVEKIQPVTVLQQKVANDAYENEALKNDEKFNSGMEKCDVSPSARKMTPFDFFCRKHRLEVASVNPDLNNHQIAQILTEKWSQLLPSERAIYKNMVSKDYPKPIQNKEKLGKIVSQNLNKDKDSQCNLKKKPKMKQKLVEKSILFTMPNPCSEIISSQDEEDESLNIINFLAPGVWICLQESKLFLLNSFRLQEAIIYQRLLDTYQFEIEPVESSFILSASKHQKHR